MASWAEDQERGQRFDDLLRDEPGWDESGWIVETRHQRIGVWRQVGPAMDRFNAEAAVINKRRLWPDGLYEFRARRG